MAKHHNILFIGSVGLEDNESVFRALSENVGSHAKRYPDGETGARTHWFMWQSQLLITDSNWEIGENVDMNFGGWEMKGRPYYKLHDDVDPAGFTFGSIGYAKEAIASYNCFKRLREDGSIPEGTRFQVSLPTPAAVIIGLVVEAQRAAIEPAYEAAMQREVQEICNTIPHHDLSIQWDVCTELLGFDGGPEPVYYDDILGGTLERIERLASWIPDGAELGIHLCYGDPGHKHIQEPVDTKSAVTFANGISERVSRALDWIHLPVPHNRDDDAYFEPLAELRLKSETELYLGLIHQRLGREGIGHLIETAERYVGDFGIATECGFGRRDPSTIPDLLKLHAEVSSS